MRKFRRDEKDYLYSLFFLYPLVFGTCKFSCFIENNYLRLLVFLQSALSDLVKFPVLMKDEYLCSLNRIRGKKKRERKERKINKWETSVNNRYNNSMLAMILRFQHSIFAAIKVHRVSKRLSEAESFERRNASSAP